MDTYIRDVTDTQIETHIFDDMGLKNFIAKNACGLHIFQMNIRSLAKNLDELLLLFDNCGISFDILMLTETWHIDDINLYQIPGYNALYNGGALN